MTNGAQNVFRMNLETGLWGASTPLSLTITHRCIPWAGDPACCPSPAEGCVNLDRFHPVSDLTCHSDPRRDLLLSPRLAQSPHLLSLNRHRKHPTPQVQATAVPVTHTSEDIGLGTGWPGLLQLTSYFQRFGNRWHLVYWLWSSGTWIPEQAGATWGSPQ